MSMDAMIEQLQQQFRAQVEARREELREKLRDGGVVVVVLHGPDDAAKTGQPSAKLTVSYSVSPWGGAADDEAAEAASPLNENHPFLGSDDAFYAAEYRRGAPGSAGR